MLEVNIGPFLAAIGATGFILGFALQGTLSNFAAGLMILLYRPYDIGDFVNVAGTNGTVSAMSLVSTTLKSDNQVVTIPNGSIWGGIITNGTAQKPAGTRMMLIPKPPSPPLAKGRRGISPQHADRITRHSQLPMKLFFCGSGILPR